MLQEPVSIRETTRADLGNILKLWNDGEVMRYVGFPDGLGVDLPYLDRWLKWIESGRPLINHYSVYADEIGYCGETFYRIDPQREHKAAMDIKLLPAARGRGIASAALAFAMERAFANGASCVWVDPNPENEKALALYRRLRFVEKPYPQELREGDQAVSTIYFELQKSQ